MGESMKFQVTIDFRKGPSYSVEVNAVNERDAKAWALKNAFYCGFDGKPKKITVRPA
jgi:hypothetical protein